METCTWAQEPDYKQKTRALLFLKSPKLMLYIWWVNKFVARKTSLELLGSLYTSTKHAWRAQQWDGHRR